jgi:hypothetical protein
LDEEWLDAEISTRRHTTFPRERETFMHPAEFEPTIPAGERPQTHALDRAATGTGTNVHRNISIYVQIGLRCGFNICLTVHH